MNFFVLENIKEKQSFAWENELKSLPSDTIAFRYYRQDNIDMQGKMPVYEYRIGILVHQVIGDIYNKVEQYSLNDKERELYCYYSQDGIRKINLVTQNMCLVNNFDELQEAFSFITKKEKSKKL